MFYQAIVLSQDTFSVRTNPHKDFPEHWHSDLEIIYCHQGAFGVSFEKQEFIVREGQILFVGSSVPHAYFNCTKDCMVTLLRIGSLFFGSTLFMEIAKKQFVNPVLEDDKEAQEIFLHVAKLYEKEGTLVNKLMLQGLVQIIVSLLLERLPQKDDFVNYDKRLNSVLNIQKTLDYVSKCFAQDITVDTAAKVSGYSKGAFCRVFKEATDMSFHQYLTNYRVQMACVLLQESQFPMTKVAEKAGFQDMKTFGRVFKQIKGIPPSEYRKKYNVK